MENGKWKMENGRGEGRVAVIVLMMVLLGEAMAGGGHGISAITLAARDAAGHRHAVTLGAHKDATMGFDVALGQLPVPPAPAGGFDLRILDPPGHTREPGTGAYADLRPFTSRTQVDTFLVMFRTADESYPITLTFVGDLADRCDSVAVFLHIDGEMRRVARELLSWSVPDASVTVATIIRYGVIPARRLSVEP